MSSSATIAAPVPVKSGPPRSTTKLTKAIGVWLVFLALAAATLYPLFFLVSAAVRPTADYTHSPAGLPTQFTLDQFSTAFDRAHIAQYGLNSVLIVVPTVILLTVLATLAAYALSSFDFRLRGLILGVVVGLLAIPPTILLIPIFKFMKDAGLLDDRLGLILVYTALALPFSIFLLSSFMRLVPGELLQAAKIDGAGSLRTLWSVVIPLVRPALLTLATLNFLFAWNEFIFSLVLIQGESKRTIMVGLADVQQQYSSNVGALSAGLLLSMIPPVLIFVFFQRSLTQGITAGALK